MRNRNSLYFILLLLTFYFSQRIKAQQFAEIPKVYSKIVVDGIMDDVWKDLKQNLITFQIDGTSYPDSADCSGYFKAFWGLDTLYVLIFAYDNILFTNDPTVYLNDGFEIYLDIENLKQQEYSEHCYQFRFIPGSKSITGRWGINVWTPPTVDFAIIVDTGKYRILEAVFPLKTLGKSQDAAIGDKLGFEIEILDNDGVTRDHVLSWNKNEHLAWQNPSKMGTIKLVEDVNSVENSTYQAVTAFPNPTNSNLTIKSATQINDMLLYTLQGQLVFQKHVANITDLKIDFNSTVPGIYLLKAILENGTIINQKIIKN